MVGVVGLRGSVADVLEKRGRVRVRVKNASLTTLTATVQGFGLEMYLGADLW